MYESFYKLKDKPFRLNADSGFFFESGGHKRALAYLTYGLNQKEGFIVITGDIGTGKTTLLERLIRQVISRDITVAKLVSTQLEPDDFLHMVAAAFGLPHEQMSKPGILKSLTRFFQNKAIKNEGVLLVIDEAQNLPIKSFKELLMLSHIHAEGVPVLQTILLGQNELLNLLRSAEMEELRQRITATYTLKSMTREETSAYIEHRLKVVGWKGDPAFSSEAHDEIYLQTGGIPRKINTFCNRLMLYGYLEELHNFSSKTVRIVADELKTELEYQSGKASRYTDSLDAYIDLPESYPPEPEPSSEADAEQGDAEEAQSEHPHWVLLNEAAKSPLENQTSITGSRSAMGHAVGGFQDQPTNEIAYSEPEPTSPEQKGRRYFGWSRSSIALFFAAVVILIIYALLPSQSDMNEPLPDILLQEDITPGAGNNIAGNDNAATPAPEDTDTDAISDQAESDVSSDSPIEPSAQVAMPDFPLDSSVASSAQREAEESDPRSFGNARDQPDADQLASITVEQESNANPSVTTATPKSNETTPETRSGSQQESIPPGKDDNENRSSTIATITPSTATDPRLPKPSTESRESANGDTVASITPDQPAKNDGAITIRELNSLASTFSRAYESGNLELLMSLFSEDARTNSQNSKTGIAADYRELFQLSEKRSFTFSRLRWEQDQSGGLKGEGDFEVNVNFKDDPIVTSVQGKIEFHVKRSSERIVITEMLHSYN